MKGHPAFTEQGSHNGLLTSDIREKSTYQRIKWLLQKYHKKYFLHYVRGLYKR
jgi:hypothetical protein